jgi:hypothetical protein
MGGVDYTVMKNLNITGNKLVTNDAERVVKELYDDILIRDQKTDCHFQAVLPWQHWHAG